MDPGREETLTFPESETLVRVGVWGAAAEVAAAGDRHPENDSARGSFRVYPPGLVWPRGWVEVEPIPLTPSSKAVKDGGWLAIDPAQDVIYCGKGYKTPDFYSRPVLGTVWTQLTSIPLGLEAKPPYKGAQGICDGEGSVYATKGNGTVGFWRYDIGAQTWTQLPNVPLGPSGKKVKGGTDMAYVVENDTGYVYLLKGYKQDFFRFNTVSGVWDTNLSLAPAGARAKYDKGSFLVHDEAGKLYAHKAKYHELWAFDIVTHTWASTALPGMPLVGMMGKSKKSKDGGAGAWFDGSVYALKGGNTQEFWQFRVDSAAWRELDTMPAYGSTGKKKRVKAGGDIVYSSLAFWALKGNKTLEFWRYGLSLDVEGTARPERSGIAAGPRGMPARFGYALRPSPVAGRDCALEYSVPQPTAVRCRLFDASGRLVRTMPGGTLSGSGLLRLDLGGLSAGVYLFRLEAEAEGAGFVQKLVLR
ncbi:hypothetical protein FJY71_08805 [candidate division WOR-3 bacterium]|nr:hypothetical protein [candidate division WOR-3 bacterium]